MKWLCRQQYSIIGVWLFSSVLQACGPLLGQLPDDTEPTEEDLYGKENTITIIANQQEFIVPANGLFKIFTVEQTPEIPQHTVLVAGGHEDNVGIFFKLIEDGDEISISGFDGVSSIFSLDGLVYFDLKLGDKNYASLIYGEGAGGTTVYYDSFFTIKKLQIDRRENSKGEIFELKGTFKAYLRERGKENKPAILIDGKVNYVNYPD